MKKISRTRRGLAVLAMLMAVLVLLFGACRKQEADTPANTREPAANVSEPDLGAVPPPAEEAEETEQNAFMEWLSQEGSDTLELKEDVTITALTYINGDKTITGSGSIIMEAAGDFMLVVNDGASLTLDGAFVDGAGNAENGIYVCENGALKITSGGVKHVTGYAVRVLGTAQADNCTISDAGTNWMVVDTGASAVINSGSFTNAGAEGILAAEGSEVTLGKDVVMSGAKGSLLYNCGTMHVEGGSYSGTSAYAFHNEGTMDVKDTDFAGASALGYLENTAGGTTTVTGGSMTESKGDFVFNQGTMTLSGIAFDNCAGTAIETRGSAGSLEISDCSFANVGKTAILAKNTTVTAADLTIGVCGSYAVHNRASDFTGTNITVESATEVAFYNDFAQDGDSAGCGSFAADGFTVGTAGSFGIRNNGGTMTLANGTVGKTGNYALYAKDGVVSTDNVRFDGVLDKTKNVVQIGLSTAPAGVVTMNETYITGGSRGITNHGELTFNSGSIYGNISAGENRVGAAINNHGTLVVNGGTFSGNRAASSGGAIYNSGSCTINSGDFLYNYSAASGGAVATSSDELYIKGGLYYGNKAANYGGALYCNDEGTVITTAGLFENNYAGKGGGAISISGAGRLYGGTVKNNTTGALGGGIYNGTKGTAVLSEMYVTGNSSADDKSGGGVYNLGKMEILGGTYTGNTSGSYGGGISNSTSSDGTRSGTMTISGGTINGNTAAKGGGGVYNTGTMTISGGNISNNHVGTRGEGVYTSGTLRLTGGTINGHSAGNDGTPYDLYVYKGTAYVSGAPDFRSVYVASTGTLAVGGTITGEPYDLYLNNYDIGTTAIGGSSTLVAANKDSFVLPAAATDAGKYIGDNGIITKDTAPEEAEPQAAYYTGSSTAGTPADKGSFADMCAKANASGGTVVVLKDLTGVEGFTMGSYTIDGSGHSIEMADSIKTASNAEAVIKNVNFTASGTVTAALIYNYNGKKLTMSDCSVKNVNSTANYGAAVYTAAILDMTNVTVTGCSGTGSGGGLFATSKSTVTLTDCTITGNTSAKNGNDIYAGNVMTIAGSTRIGEIYLAKDQTVTTSGWTGTAGVKIGSSYFTAGTAIAGNNLTDAEISSISLLNTENESIYLGTDGKLAEKVTEPEIPEEPETYEAYWFTGSTAGAPDEKGTFADMLAKAQASGGILQLQSDVTAAGFTMAGFTLDGNGKTLTLSSQISTTKATSSAMKNVTLAAAGTGFRAVNNAGTLTLESVTISGFKGCTNSGGAIQVTSTGSLTLKDSTVTGNECVSTKSGNDIFVNNSNTAVISGSTRVGELYLATGKTFVIDSSWSGTIGLKVDPANFTSGTALVSGSLTEAEISRITLLNTGNESIYLGTDGKLAEKVTEPETPVEPEEPEEPEPVVYNVVITDADGSQLAADNDLDTALTAAKAAGTVKTITLNGSVSTAGFDMTGWTIAGNGNAITLNGAVTVSSGTNRMTGVTLKQGTTLPGAAITNKATLTLSGCTISGFANTAAADTSTSAAIYNNKGTLTLSNTTISSCTNGGKYGGAIYNYNGSVTVSNGSSITGNTASNASGGGIFNSSGATCVITDSTVTGNSCGSGKYGKDVYIGSSTASASTLGGSCSITEYYIASGACFSFSSELTGSVKVKSATANANTVVVTQGTLTDEQFAASLGKLSAWSSSYSFGADGTLVKN